MNPVTAAKGIVKRNSNALLLVVCLGQFMVVLDVSIVNVALPSIKDSLGFSTNGLQWVLNAYTLTYAGFLLLGGRASDLFGRRRMFFAGTLLFSGRLAALRDLSQLRGADRRSLGAGHRRALLSPATLAIITTSFDEGAPRNRALGAWGAVGAIGATAGVLLGGVLTEAFSWPAIFLINVPIGLAIVLFSAQPDPRGPQRVREPPLRPRRRPPGHARDDRAHLRDRHHRPARLGLPGRARPGRRRRRPAGRVRPLREPVSTAYPQGGADAAEHLQAADPARRELRDLPALRRDLRLLVLPVPLHAGHAPLQRAHHRPRLRADDGRRRRRCDPRPEDRQARLAADRPRRGHALRRGRGVPAHQRPSRRHLRRERPPRRPARRLRSRPRAGAGDDRRRAGRPAGGQRARLRRPQHLPVRRRGPRPRRAEHPRREPHEQRDRSGTSAARALTDGFQLQFGIGAIFCLVGAIAALVMLRPQRERQPAPGIAEAERA